MSTATAAAPASSSAPAQPSFGSRMATGGVNMLKSGADLAGRGAGFLGRGLSAGASGFKSGLLSFIEHHKVHGFIFVITTLVLLIISIIDMSNAKWGTDVTDEQKRNRDITISTFTFTLILFFYMIFREFNYLMPSFLKIAATPAAAAV